MLLHKYPVGRSANKRCAFSMDLVERTKMPRGREGKVKGKDSLQDDADVGKVRTLLIGTDDDMLRNG